MSAQRWCLNPRRSPHSFFFKTIAVRRLTTREGTVEAPFIQELVVAPGQTADLELVAPAPGEYSLVCDEPLHEIFGMTGAIHVQ
jgi:uncharacterized cupredoxin-like copper-binding protein